MKKSKRKRRRFSLVLVVLMTLIICMGVQRSVFRFLESNGGNFVSPMGMEITMIRMQNVHKLQGDVIIMGSSLTERFRSNEDTAILGIPGSSFIAGLELLDGVVEFPVGMVYVLEINNMFNGVYQYVLNDAKRWNFHLFRRSSHFSIAAKPSNLMLRCAEYVIRHRVDDRSSSCNRIPVMSPANTTGVDDLTLHELENLKDIVAGIAKIRQRGGRICFVRLPVANPKSYHGAYKDACKLAKHLKIPVLDYNTDFWREKLDFTDGAHLNSRATSTFVFRDVIARDAKKCSK